MVLFSLLLPLRLASGQDATFNGKPTTIDSRDGRGLAYVLDRLQGLYLTRVTYEEVPFENPAELISATVVYNGISTAVLANPVINFSVTLGPSDSSAYAAAQSVMVAYGSASMPGTYTVVQATGRVDVIPARVLGVSGAIRDVAPVMSRPVTFPVATRTVADTVQLIVDGLSASSGFRVVLLDAPHLEAVSLGAAGEAARDVIGKMASTLGLPITFQCLYDAGDKTYYLNVKIVAPAPVAGGPALHGYIKPLPRVGPANSPFFTKDK